MIFDLENGNWKNSEVASEMIRLLSLASADAESMVVDTVEEVFEPTSEDAIVSLAAEISGALAHANLTPVITALAGHLGNLLSAGSLTESQRFKIDSAIAELKDISADS